MPVRKRGDIWHVRVQIAGQRIERTTGRGATRADALALEAQIRRDHVDGRVGRAPKRTIDQAVARWLTGDAALLKSHANLVGKVAAIESAITGQPLARIVEVAEAIKADGIRDKLNPATINRRLAILRRVANLASAQWGWLDTDLGRRIKLLPCESARHIYLTPKEVERLATKCEHPRVADAIRLAAMSGLREGELLGITPDQVRDGCIALGPRTKTGRRAPYRYPKRRKPSPCRWASPTQRCAPTSSAPATPPDCRTSASTTCATHTPVGWFNQVLGLPRCGICSATPISPSPVDTRTWPPGTCARPPRRLVRKWQRDKNGAKQPAKPHEIRETPGLLSPLCLPISPSGRLIYKDNLRQAATGNASICPVNGAKTGQESGGHGAIFIGSDSTRRAQIAARSADSSLGHGASGRRRSIWIA